MELNTELMTHLESLTKKGDTQQVSEIVDSLVLKRIPRPLAAPLAQICFRNSLYLQSLRVLNPIVSPTAPITPPPLATEIIAYATALMSLNMNREARVWLQKVDKQLYPEALLIESFTYFGEWNYQKTIPLLKKFSANPRVSYYRQVVGKVNLAAAYVTSGMNMKAEALLLSLLSITRDRGFRLLQGNTLELLAQLEIQKKDYPKALEYLTQAKAVFPDSTSIYFFFVKKWERICLMLLNPESKQLITDCENLKEEVLKWRHWETARDVDLYIAFATHNLELLEKVIVGTPNPHFQKKVELLFGYKVTPPKVLHLKTNEHPEHTIEFSAIISKLNNSKYQSQLVSILTRDLYRPANLGLLFSELHPEESFNPVTSEKRILNQIYALNKTLSSMGDFFELRKDKMDFVFKIKPNVDFILTRFKNSYQPIPSLKEKLYHLGSTPFNSSKLATLLACSQRKAQMLIKDLLKQEFIIPLNRGPRSTYALRYYYPSKSLTK